MELRLTHGFRDPTYLHKSKEEIKELKKQGIETKLLKAGWVFHGSDYASLSLNSFLELTKALNKLVDLGFTSVQISGMNYRARK